MSESGAPPSPFPSLPDRGRGRLPRHHQHSHHRRPSSSSSWRPAPAASSSTGAPQGTDSAPLPTSSASSSSSQDVRSSSGGMHPAMSGRMIPQEQGSPRMLYAEETSIRNREEQGEGSRVLDPANRGEQGGSNPRSSNVSENPRDSNLQGNPRFSNVPGNPRDSNLQGNPRFSNVSENPRESNVSENPRESNLQGNPRESNVSENPRFSNVSENPRESNLQGNPRESNLQGNPSSQDVRANPANYRAPGSRRSRGAQRNAANRASRDGIGDGDGDGSRHAMPSRREEERHRTPPRSHSNEGREGAARSNRSFGKGAHWRLIQQEEVTEGSSSRSNGKVETGQQEGASKTRFQRRDARYGSKHDIDEEERSTGRASQDEQANDRNDSSSSYDGRRRPRGIRDHIVENPRAGLDASSLGQQWRPSGLHGRRDHVVDRSEVGHGGRGFTASIGGEVRADDSIGASREAVEEALQSISISRAQRRAPESNGAMEEEASARRGPSRAMDTRKQRYIPRSKGSQRGEDLAGGEAKASSTKPAQNNNAPLLVQELEEKLSKGKVECMICYDSVRREAAVWSCGGCYAIFHIACVKKWARAPISADFSVASSDQAAGNWRCPGCQAPQFISADEIKYKCFCGQIPNPQVDYYLTPHSCGGPCKKPLSSAKNPHCKHVCTMQCHPGPCPPCNALAPPQFCPCGKTSYTQRCSELKIAKSCGQVCDHPLECGRHRCEKICHDGSCGACDAPLAVKCFCGGREESMLCGSMDLQGELEWENGVYSCRDPCAKYLSCGKHACGKQCHPGECGECELSPARVHSCPCGKTSIQKLLGPAKRRESCADEVPLCGKPCEKALPCGKHLCRSPCHAGECPKCEVEVEQKCRCQSSTRKMACRRAVATMESGGGSSRGERGGGEEELFLCNRTCGRKKSCGRHRCSNKCCPLASKKEGAAEGEGGGSPHLCLLVCGKRLRCGQHACEEMCHNGHCPPCLGSTFTELTCACGKTSIPPPVPCGTLPPPCPRPCSRPHPCGHPATHQCHFGDCPPCIVLVPKECAGSHVVLRNVPCGSKDIKCNALCGKPRRCRLHACARLCHLPPCDATTMDSPDAKTASCGQQCGAPRRDCQHVCAAACHPGSLCPEARCKFPVAISCACGRLSQQVPCDAGESSRGSDPLELAYYSSLQLLPAEGAKGRVPLGQRTLACDEECARMEKKRILADAFGVAEAAPDISPEGMRDASDALRELLKRDPHWVLSVEDRFKSLLLGTKPPASAPIRAHVFRALPREMRDAIRQIAERWSLAVSSAGREPKRFLAVHATSKAKAPPMRSLFGKSPLPLPGQAQAPAFNPSLDMDPRLVVGLFELPRDADISPLVLRFGGECELVWLNDRNALAVFSDAARAATAIRRVDHASPYCGGVRMMMSAPPERAVLGDGSSSSSSSSMKWPGPRKVSKQESSSSSWLEEDAWGEEVGKAQHNSQPGAVVWGKAGPLITTANPWGALDESRSRDRHQEKSAAVSAGDSSSSRSKFQDKAGASSSSSSGANAANAVAPSHAKIVHAPAEDWEDLEG